VALKQDNTIQKNTSEAPSRSKSTTKPIPTKLATTTINNQLISINNTLLNKFNNAINKSNNINDKVFFIKYKPKNIQGNGNDYGINIPTSLVFESRVAKKKRSPIIYQHNGIVRKRIKYNKVYRLIIASIYPFRWLCSSWMIHVKESERSLRYHISELIRLKWLMRVQGQKIMLNPLLQFLLEHNVVSPKILEFACYKIDFHKLLNYPLTLIKNPIEFRAKVMWQKKPEGVKTTKIIPSTPQLWNIFHGILYITAKMKNGLEVQTFLPINYHYDSLKTKYMKKRVVNPHYTVPCEWDLFNIKECGYYSGFNKNANRRVKVHFDNSITVMFFKNSKGSWFYKEPYQKAIQKWNGSQFIECTTPEVLEKLFTLRFKNGLRRTELFKQLGLRVKRINYTKNN